MTKIYLVSVFFLTLSYLIGSTLSKSHEKSFRRAFFNILTGLLIIVVGYALVRTKLSSVLLSIVILAAVLLQTTAFKLSFFLPKRRIFWADILKMCVTYTIFFFLHILLYSPTYGIILPLHEDHQFYAKLAYFLCDTGVESTSLGMNPSPTPYHYFDLWLAAFLIEITELPAAICLISGAYLILSSTLFFGFCAIVEKYISSAYPILFVSFTFFFASGFYLDFYSQIPGLQYSSGLSYAPLEFPKLLITYSLLVAFALNVIEKCQQGWFYFFTLAAVYISFLPAVAIVCIAGLSFSLLFPAQFNKELGLLPSANIQLAGCLSLIYIGGFYFFKSAPVLPSSEIATHLTAEYAHTFLNIILGSFVSVLALYTPLLLFVGVTSLSSLKDFFGPPNLFLFLFLLASLLTWASLNYISNSVQFFTNVLGPVMSVSLLTWFSRKYRIRSLGFAVLFAFALYTFANLSSTYYESRRHIESRHDSEFMLQISSILTKERTKGAFLRDYQDYNNHFNYSMAYATLDLQIQSLTLPNGVHTFSINLLNQPLSKDRHYYKSEMAMLMSSEFYKFRASAASTDTCFVQKEFIKENDLRFLLVAGTVNLPYCLKPFFPDSVQDNKSGLKLFYKR